MFFEKDPNLHIFYDDLKLAYKTLYNESSRAEYDEYLAEYKGLSNMYGDRHHQVEEEDEETRKRKQERGKRRFEEDFDHVNEEFFSSWQTRTKRGGAT